MKTLTKCAVVSDRSEISNGGDMQCLVLIKNGIFWNNSSDNTLLLNHYIR